MQYAEAMEAGEEQAAATTEFLSLTLRMESDRAQAFLRQDWEFDWRDAAFFNAFDDLFLDPETVVKMQAELCQVASRYADKPVHHPGGTPSRVHDARAFPTDPTTHPRASPTVSRRRWRSDSRARRPPSKPTPHCAEFRWAASSASVRARLVRSG